MQRKSFPQESHKILTVNPLLFHRLSHRFLTGFPQGRTLLQVPIVDGKQPKG